jgi:hypothetical protein
LDMGNWGSMTNAMLIGINSKLSIMPSVGTLSKNSSPYSMLGISNRNNRKNATSTPIIQKSP